jgi:hypothetical protein
MSGRSFTAPLETSHVIPQRYVEFCRELARVARKHEMTSFHCNFRPEWQSDWNDQINMAWEQGRHGEDSGHMVLTSNVMVRTSIETPVEALDPAVVSMAESIARGNNG